MSARRITLENETKLHNYLRIRPKTDISINTPILQINIGYKYLNLISSKRGIYSVDIREIRKELSKNHKWEFEHPDHIGDYVAVGQVELRYRGRGNDSSHDPNISIILANSRVIPLSDSYKMVRPNIWIAQTNMSGNEMRSLGTIYSKEKPTVPMPVFPVTYLKEINDSEPNYDIYSDSAYGRYTLNDTMLNVDKRNIRMIGTTGDIATLPSHTYVPMTAHDLYSDDMSGLDMGYNRKVYYTTQGTIATDPRCVKPSKNMNKMHHMECNGVATTITPDDKEMMAERVVDDGVLANDNGELDLNERVGASDADKQKSDSRIRRGRSKSINSRNVKDSTVRSNRSHGSRIKTRDAEYNNNTNDSVSSDSTSMSPPNVLNSRQKKIILREKDEPWFTDPDVVGNIADYDDPHKITGHHDTLQMTDSELYDMLEDMRPDGPYGSMTGDSNTLTLIGTFEGDTDEINSPVEPTCAINPPIGYSRYDQMRNCFNHSHNKSRPVGESVNSFTEPDVVEGFNNQSQNNYIMLAICLLVIVLLFYKMYY